MNDFREAVAIAFYSIAAAYFLYFAAVIAASLFLLPLLHGTAFVEIFNPLVSRDFLPPPSWLTAASMGAICGLTWLSGPFWCRRCGRWRHGDPEFYYRPENFVRRCLLLGGMAGIPAGGALLAYCAGTPLFAGAAWLYMAWTLETLFSSGPALMTMLKSPSYIFHYAIAGPAYSVLMAAPFAFSAAIGACCGWFYGRFVRPAIRRLLPNLLPAP